MKDETCQARTTKTYMAKGYDGRIVTEEVTVRCELPTGHEGLHRGLMPEPGEVYWNWPDKEKSK